MQTADCQQLTGNRCGLPLLTAPVDCRLFLVDSAPSVRHMVVDCPPTDHCSGTLGRHTHSTASWPIQPWATARSGVSCSCLSSLQMHRLKLNEAFVEMFVNVFGSVGRLCGLGLVCLQLERHNKCAKLFTLLHFRTASVIHCALSTQGCSDA